MDLDELSMDAVVALIELYVPEHERQPVKEALVAPGASERKIVIMKRSI